MTVFASDGTLARIGAERLEGLGARHLAGDEGMSLGGPPIFKIGISGAGMSIFAIDPDAPFDPIGNTVVVLSVPLDDGARVVMAFLPTEFKNLTILLTEAMHGRSN